MSAKKTLLKFLTIFLVVSPLVLNGCSYIPWIGDDDEEVPPPENAIVFFDFERITPEGVELERGPDSAAIDRNQVSELTHSVELFSDGRADAGLTREHVEISKAAGAEVWLDNFSLTKIF